MKIPAPGDGEGSPVYVLPADGIAFDIAQFFAALERNGRGFSVIYTTPGNSIDMPMLGTYNYMCPRIVLVNHGTSTVNWGFGSANQPLEAGASITLEWKNPVLNALVYNDLGTSGVIIGVTG